MRYAPAALALSLLAAVTASVGHGAAPQPLTPRAAQLEEAGRAALAAGDYDTATDGFEAALAVQPGHAALLLDLADVARREGLQGKALHYYRVVLADDPQNLLAIAGEGSALAEKGALDKARRDLARLEGACGTNCPATQQLIAVLTKAAAPKMVAADNLKPDARVTN